jgi:hypothetical protein
MGGEVPTEGNHSFIGEARTTPGKELRLQRPVKVFMVHREKKVTNKVSDLGTPCHSCRSIQLYHIIHIDN